MYILHRPVIIPPPQLGRRNASAFLIVVLVIAVLSSMLTVSIAKITAVNIDSTGAVKIANEAQNIAADEAALIRSMEYTKLVAKTRTAVSNTLYEKEIFLTNESAYSDTIKERTVKINVYKGKESLPRASARVTRYSQEQKTSGVPIGTIIAWISKKNPADGTWLDCNGQSCSKYPELVSLLGQNTVPDFRNRFLEGGTTPGNIIAAGLPNITGVFGYINDDAGVTYNGAFSFSRTGSMAHENAGNSGHQWKVSFDASKSSSIYGKSTTVQPPAVIVRYLIKAG